jgi:hypothetical protein
MEINILLSGEHNLEGPFSLEGDGRVEGDLGPGDVLDFPIETSAEDFVLSKIAIRDQVPVRREGETLLLTSLLPDLKCLVESTLGDEKFDVSNRLSSIGLKAEGESSVPCLSSRRWIPIPIEVGQVMPEGRRIFGNDSIQDKVGVVHRFFQDIIDQGALIWVVREDIREMGEGLLDLSQLEKKIGGHPSAPIARGKDPDGIFHSPLRDTAFPHPLKGLCQLEPVFLLQGIPLDRLPEITGGRLEIDMADIPLIEQSQPIIGFGISGAEPNGFEKILFRRGDGAESDTPPQAKDRITR